MADARHPPLCGRRGPGLDARAHRRPHDAVRGGRHRQLEPTDDVSGGRGTWFANASAAAGTRIERELLAAFRDAGIGTEGQRGVHILGRLAQLGILVLAARDSWALLDEWVPQPRRLARAEALEEFAFRYFSSHGPATVNDFSWWSSLTLTDARAGLAGPATASTSSRSTPSPTISAPASSLLHARCISFPVSTSTFSATATAAHRSPASTPTP